MKTMTLILTLLSLALAAQAQNNPTLVWTGYGEMGNNYYGSSSCGGDFNNDGYSDVLIGAGGWGSIGGNGAIGKNYLYLGSPDFFDTASFYFIGDSAEDWFDLDISSVQDVNGDGSLDFLIPAAFSLPGGYAEVFFGGSILDTVADWRAQKQSTVYYEKFGFSTDSVGDVNGDGWSDFVISGGDNDVDSCYIEIYFGGPSLDTIPDWRFKDLAWAIYPFYVKGLGDINGDGFDDLLAYKESIVPYAGKIFFGGSPMDTISDLEFHPGIMDGAGVGDVNADGYGDFALWVYDPPDSVGTAVYFGGSDVDTIPDVPLINFWGDPAGSADGISHADVNGDGFSDIVCDASSMLGVYLGSPWMNGILDWWYVEFWMWDGFSVSGVGDVNGDGCDDFVLGMPYTDVGNWARAGKAYLYSGNPNMVDLGAAVEPENLQHYPGWFKLDQNYPNPFNSTTSIHFELGKPSTVDLTIYDLMGAKINHLIVNKRMLPGGYNVSWNGKNEFHQEVPSGIYLLELQVDRYRQLKKLVLVR